SLVGPANEFAKEAPRTDVAPPAVVAPPTALVPGAAKLVVIGLSVELAVGWAIALGGPPLLAVARELPGAAPLPAAASKLVCPWTARGGSVPALGETCCARCPVFTTIWANCSGSESRPSASIGN